MELRSTWCHYKPCTANGCSRVGPLMQCRKIRPAARLDTQAMSSPNKSTLENHLLHFVPARGRVYFIDCFALPSVKANVFILWPPGRNPMCWSSDAVEVHLLSHFQVRLSMYQYPLTAYLASSCISVHDGILGASMKH